MPKLWPQTLTYSPYPAGTLDEFKISLENNVNYRADVEIIKDGEKSLFIATCGEKSACLFFIKEDSETIWPVVATGPDGITKKCDSPESLKSALIAITHSQHCQDILFCLTSCQREETVV